MKRFASIDFLRGVAILLMLFLHILSDMLDINSLVSRINDIPVINVLLLAILPFLGGLAGFLLLVSATGNMISMQKFLEKGQSVRNLVVRQVLGGVLLLIFAMLTEAVIGYHGALGQIFLNISRMDLDYIRKLMLTQWNVFETIHTIAWCVIINGIIHGILARKDGWKNTRGMIWKYLVLSIIIVVLTQPVWMLLSWLVPGYPWATVLGSGSVICRPEIGADPWWMILTAPFLAPLAAPYEPIFPYLAVSFWGSIIGIVMCQPADKIPRSFMKKGLILGLIMFFIGAIGIVVNVVAVINVNFDLAVKMYKEVSFHRHWFPDQPEYGEFLIPLAWLWQFLGLNGFGLMFTLIIIYLVEFRGKGSSFANHTRFVRRFGFIAFTNYNNQWYMWLVWAAISFIVVGIPYSQLNWGFTLSIVVIVILLYHLINRFWEKAGYIGSVEWMIGTLGYVINPFKRDSREGRKWYEIGKLDVQGAFYHPEWLNIIEADDVYHYHQRDSKIIEKIAVWCFAIPLFIPFGILLVPALIKAKKIEGKNVHLKRAQVLISFATGITLALLILSFIFTPNMIGFQI